MRVTNKMIIQRLASDGVEPDDISVFLLEQIYLDLRGAVPHRFDGYASNRTWISENRADKIIEQYESIL